MGLSLRSVALAMTALLAISEAGAASAGSFVVNSLPSSTVASSEVSGAPFSGSAVARTADGTSVIAWSGAEGAATDYSTYVRVYQKDGMPLSTEFVANATVASPSAEPMSPAVAVSDSGHFVVAWYQTDLTGMGSAVLKARLFATDGTPLTGEFCLDPACTAYPPPAGNYPETVVMDAQGNFVVAWIGYNTSTDGTVLMRRFAADGTAEDAAPVAVKTVPGSALAGLAAAVDPSSGDYVLAWQQQSGFDLAQYPIGVGDQVIASQRFHANGEPAGIRVLVSGCAGVESYTPLAGCEFWTLSTIAVTMDAAGNSAVLWWQYGPLSGGKFYGQRYDALGLLDGLPFVAAAPSSQGNGPYYFSAASDGAGDLMLVWVSDVDYGVNYNLYEQKVKANNLRDGGIVQLSPGNLSARTGAVAADPSGNVTAAWIQINSPESFGPPTAESDTLLGEFFTLP